MENFQTRLNFLYGPFSEEPYQQSNQIYNICCHLARHSKVEIDKETNCVVIQSIRYPLFALVLYLCHRFSKRILIREDYESVWQLLNFHHCPGFLL